MMTPKQECPEAQKLKRDYEDETNPKWKKKAKERYEAHKKHCAECNK